MSFTYKNNTQQVLKALSGPNGAIPRGLEAIGLAAEGHAKKETPVDTGRLRNSISHTTDKEAAYIGTNVEYAPYIELGVQGRQGVHMLQRAATEHTAEYQKLMEENIKNA